MKRIEISARRQALLEVAAGLIVERGSSCLNVSELSARSGIPRPTVYADFPHPNIRIRRMILVVFLRKLRESVETTLACLERNQSEVERIAAMFRAVIYTFKSSGTIGRASTMLLLDQRLKRLPDLVWLQREAEVHLSRATARGELTCVAKAVGFPHIRSLLFGVLFGLLQTLHVGPNPCPPRSKSDLPLTETEVHVEMLRILQVYCNDDAKSRLQSIMDALLRKRAAAV
ncbi:MAG TPA: hypothetical protein VI981_01690 [Candidatus Paceibacterota bacterium]